MLGDSEFCVGEVDSRIESRSGVARGIGKSVELAKEGLICDSSLEKISDVSLRQPAEALECLTFEGSDSPKEWKDSSSEEGHSMGIILSPDEELPPSDSYLIDSLSS